MQSCVTGNWKSPQPRLDRPISDRFIDPLPYVENRKLLTFFLLFPHLRIVYADDAARGTVNCFFVSHLVYLNLPCQVDTTEQGCQPHYNIYSIVATIVLYFGSAYYLHTVEEIYSTQKYYIFNTKLSCDKQQKSLQK